MMGLLLLAVATLAWQAPQSKIDLSELRARLHFISQHIQAGRLDEAQSSLDLLRSDAGPQPLVDGMQGFLLYRQHQYARAVEVLQHALESPSPPTWWRVLLAMSYVANGQEDLGKAKLKHARQDDSKGLPDALNAMYQAAVVDVTNSPTVDGTLALVFVSLSMGNRRYALQTLNDQVKAFPKEPRLRTARIELLTDTGDWKSALAEAKAALEAVGENAQIHLLLGSLFGRNEDYPQAVPHLQKAIELDPKNVRARLELGHLYYQQNNLAEARKELETVLTFPSLDLPAGLQAAACASLGAVLTDSKQWKEAATVLQKGLAIEPDSPILLNNMAWLFVTSESPEIRNPKRAVELAEKAVALSQQRNPSMLDTLAEAYFAAGEGQKALEAERKAIALAPGRADLKEHLARFEGKKP